MIRIDIQHPYAHDLMLSALDIVAAGYPIAHELKPVEQIGLGGLMLEGRKLSYDPVELMKISFNDLVTSVHTVYITYYLKQVPRACVFRLNEDVQH